MSRHSVLPGGPSTSARQSLFPGGSSGGGHHTLGSSNTGSHAAARLAAKQAELDGLRELKNYSALLVKELERMGEGLNQIRNGGESVSQVMSTWQTVFRGIQVAQASVAQDAQKANAQDKNEVGEEEADRLANLLPDTLVRIPVEQGGPASQSAVPEGED